MKVFRPTLLAAALIVTLTASLAHAQNADQLPRAKVALVAPPQVHPHEQVAKGGPKVVEFTMTIEEKKMVIDDKGTTLQAMTFDLLHARPHAGGARGRLCGTDPGQPRHQRHAAQRRLPRRHRRWAAPS